MLHSYSSRLNTQHSLDLEYSIMHVLVYVNWGSMALFGIYLKNAMPMIEYLWTCFGSDLSHFMWLSGKLWILLITVTGALLVWVVQQVPVSLLSHAMSYLVCHIPISVLQYWWMMVYSSLVYSNTYIFDVFWLTIIQILRKRKLSSRSEVEAEAEGKQKPFASTSLKNLTFLRRKVTFKGI